MNIQSIVARFGKYLIAVVVAVVLFVSGAVTDAGEAVQLALSPEKAIQQAAELINQTPPAEVEKALQ